MFARRADGSLWVESVSLDEIAERLGTPAYVYSRAMIEAAYEGYRTALSGLDNLICVSVKANSNLSLLSLLVARGAGFDVVSGGELQRVARAGGDLTKVVFAGVGKTDDEIRLALDSNILMFNVESPAELARINEIVVERGETNGRGLKRARVALRVNPDVEAYTHHHISTGREEHKFGVPIAEARALYQTYDKFEGLEFVGIDCHIGSNIKSSDSFREAFRRIKELVTELRSIIPTFSIIDLGGGLGVSYDGAEVMSIADYGALVREAFGNFGCKIIVEPGRSIFGPAGVLLTEVCFVKKTAKKEFVVFDAGFNDLIRPVLYEAYHTCEPVLLNRERGEIVADLVGPVCETGDCFAKDRLIQQALRGERYVFRTAGAYGFSMSSNYNTRPRPIEVLVDHDRVVVVRAREKIEDLYAHEEQGLSELSSASPIAEQARKEGFAQNV